MKRLLILLMLIAPLWAQKPRVQPPPIDAAIQAKLTALKAQIDAAKADLDAATKKLNDLQVEDLSLLYQKRYLLLQSHVEKLERLGDAIDQDGEKQMEAALDSLQRLPDPSTPHLALVIKTPQS